MSQGNNEKKETEAVLEKIVTLFEKDRDITLDTIPLYQTLVDMIRCLILEGKLKDGERLPTFTRLASELKISKGTVSHAYNILAAEGYLELTQGKGSFVSYEEKETSASFSRKDAAMQAIDVMLQEMQKLAFSRREIQIFIDLKMREFYEEAGNISVAVIADSPDERIILLQELKSIKYANFTAYRFDNFLEGNIELDLFDAIITTEDVYLSTKLRTDHDNIKQVLPVIMALDPHSIINLAALPSDTHLGIISFAHSFSKTMQESCANYAKLHNSPQTYLLSENRLEIFLRECDTILLPFVLFDYINEEQRKELDTFVKRGGSLLNYKLIPEKASLFNIHMKLEELANQGKEQI